VDAWVGLMLASGSHKTVVLMDNGAAVRRYQAVGAQRADLATFLDRA
jgi:hypothetical protein